MKQNEQTSSFCLHANTENQPTLMLQVNCLATSTPGKTPLLAWGIRNRWQAPIKTWRGSIGDHVSPCPGVCIDWQLFLFCRAGPRGQQPGSLFCQLQTAAVCPGRDPRHHREPGPGLAPLWPLQPVHPLAPVPRQSSRLPPSNISLPWSRLPLGREERQRRRGRATAKTWKAEVAAKTYVQMVMKSRTSRLLIFLNTCVLTCLEFYFFFTIIFPNYI